MMLFVRGFAAGAVSVGVSCFAAYHLVSEASQPHIEYQEPPIRQKEIVKYGTPQRSPELTVYRNHALCYDQQRRIAHWVVEHITRHKLQGSANRENSKFKADPSVPVMFRSDNEDYLGSGWSRGHLAPAGDCKHDQNAMNDTFLLSNIVPQNADNNAGFWNRLETYCRDLSAKYENVWVISGPVFLPTVSVDKGKTRKFMHHEVVGPHDVAVPTHLFKVVVAENEKDRPLVGAFVVPNESIDNERQLREFQVPLEYVESRTGLHMLPLLDRQKARDLCTVDSCRMKTWRELQLYYTTRRIDKARTLAPLDKAWKDAADKKLQTDHQLIATYEAKRKQLQGLAASRAQG
jgi:nuclease EXOG